MTGFFVNHGCKYTHSDALRPTYKRLSRDTYSTALAVIHATTIN